MTLVGVDMFAGCGGLTEGAEQAGAKVVVALNHWDFAVKVHALNHPRTQHLLQDARQAEWRNLPAFNLLMGGPSCQGHSDAGQPGRKHSDKVQEQHEIDRATAWALTTCAEVCRPDWIVAENVMRWLRWPLFDLWRETLHRLGYATRVLVLDASRYGVAQARRRVFVIGNRSEAAVDHAAHTIEAAAAPKHAPRPGAGTIVDFDAGRWRDTDRCGHGSRARIVAGLEFGVDRWWCQHVTGHRGKTMDAPLSTITGADQHVLCRRVGKRVEYRPLLASELLAAQGFPKGYRLPEKYRRRDLCRAIGNAVPVPLGRTIVSAIREAS